MERAPRMGKRESKYGVAMRIQTRKQSKAIAVRRFLVWISVLLHLRVCRVKGGFTSALFACGDVWVYCDLW
jgi:hypothetical protein